MRSCLLALLTCCLAAADLTAIPTGTTDYQVWQADRQLFIIETRILDKAWMEPALAGEPRVEGSRRVLEAQGAFPHDGGRRQKRGKAAAGGQGIPFRFSFTAEAAGANCLRLGTSTTAEEDVEAVGVATVITTTEHFAGGKAVFTLADGSEQTCDLPLAKGTTCAQTTRITLTTAAGETLRITPSRPLAVTSDHAELRIWTWSKNLAADTAQTASLDCTFAQPLRVETANRLVDTSAWIPYRPRQDMAPGSPIGAEGWLDAPAGKHGWVQMESDHLVYADTHQPIRFWGTNIAFARMAVAPEMAREWAAKFAKYGVNLVRMHKWTGNNGWDGVMSKSDVLAFDEDASSRFDNFHAELRQRGIYVGWSPIFALKLHDSMAKHLAHFDEIQAGVAKRSGMFANSLYPLQTIAEEVQDLYIKLTVAWLERRNAVTGLRYADDPAVAYIELHNEADVFFFGTGKLLQTYPSYTRLMQERFSAWLRQTYADDAALAAAWGDQLRKNERLAQASISPFPVNYDGTLPAPRRVVDSYRFLLSWQNSFYERYAAAIRKTGYGGVIVGGCWQATDLYGHLMNLASDRQVGAIDRHNYFKGDRPMIAQPGSALLGAGMQQVADRPFGLSEWASHHVWSAEGPPLIGLVGVGLQGWDYATQFASGTSIVIPDDDGTVNSRFDEFRSTIQHPFIARFLLGGALKEGTVVARRHISMAELDAGTVGFNERFSLLGDQKTFTGSFPAEALGAGRAVISFDPAPVSPAVEMPGLSACLDLAQRRIQASNGQMQWDWSGRGFLTADTPAALAVIGFGGGREHHLSVATVRYDTPFANVYLAAQQPGRSLAEADRLIVLAIARTANQGDVLEETAMTPRTRAPREEKGRTPEEQRGLLLANQRLLIEPVRASLLLRRHVASVVALDHDGCLPAQAAAIPTTATPDGIRIELDGRATGAFAYLITCTP